MKSVTIETLKKKLDQLKKIDGVTKVSLRELAKESSLKPTDFMDIVEKSPTLFELVEEKDKKHLYVKNIFLEEKENPETQSWLNDQIKQNEKTIKISHYNNYGHVSGYYIEPSTKKEAQYLNTEDKINLIKDKFSLKNAGYHIGGIGDSSYHKVKNGFEISFSQLEELKKEGWIIIGRYEKEPFYMP